MVELMSMESESERRSRIIAEQEAREKETGIKAQRLKDARGQERTKMRPLSTYLPGAERAVISKPVIPR